jgi:anti-sigma regulatory factor (Ser/Thr protein kinase)
MSFTYSDDLSQVRALVEEQAREASLPERKVIDLVLAVSEIAANTVRHARSPGRVDITTDEDEIVCTIRDAGRITDPFAGRRGLSLDADRGLGLWLVHQVCDVVELDSDDAGTTIRLHMTIPRR